MITFDSILPATQAAAAPDFLYHYVLWDGCKLLNVIIAQAIRIKWQAHTQCASLTNAAINKVQAPQRTCQAYAAVKLQSFSPAGP